MKKIVTMGLLCFVSIITLSSFVAINSKTLNSSKSNSSKFYCTATLTRHFFYSDGGFAGSHTTIFRAGNCQDAMAGAKRNMAAMIWEDSIIKPIWADPEPPTEINPLNRL